MTERLSTGNDRLDLILGGGLVLNSITLLVGAPGSGKTLVAEQCVFAAASVDRPGLYLSTVSEPLDKLLRYGQSLRFFDVEQVGRSVFYEDLGSVLNDGALPAVLERIDLLVKEHRPGVVVIDSFKALRVFADGDADFRRFLHELAGRMTALAISSISTRKRKPPFSGACARHCASTPASSSTVSTSVEPSRVSSRTTWRRARDSPRTPGTSTASR